MKNIGMLIFGILLAGCGPAKAPAEPEALSPMVYKDCIEAAMRGDGQASTENCEKVTQDAR